MHFIVASSETAGKPGKVAGFAAFRFAIAGPDAVARPSATTAATFAAFTARRAIDAWIERKLELYLRYRKTGPDLAVMAL